MRALFLIFHNSRGFFIYFKNFFARHLATTKIIWFDLTFKPSTKDIIKGKFNINQGVFRSTIGPKTNNININ